MMIPQYSFTTVDFSIDFERMTAVLPSDKVPMFQHALKSYKEKAIGFKLLEKFLLQCNGFIRN